MALKDPNMSKQNTTGKRKC